MVDVQSSMLVFVHLYRPPLFRGILVVDVQSSMLVFDMNVASGCTLFSYL